ncbi:MAG: signal peptide peptidase SppA [Planctomycetota bacterium]
MATLLSFLVVGCASHPVRALVGGNMRLGGNMGVNGQIDMKGDVATTSKTDNTATPVQTRVVDGVDCGAGRIAIVDVDGLITDDVISGFGSMGENPVALFREKIRRIEDDSTISAVVLRINTPGGGVTASDMIAHDVDRLKLSRGLPVVACLMTTATGGGFYLATSADALVAHPTSVVGGIGVILNTYNMEDTLAQYNILATPIKSGAKIDVGTPQRMMEEDEQALLEGMAKQFHDRFIERVQRTRGERLEPDESLFDGRVMSGQKAFDSGLIDQLGYLDDAIELAGQLAGLPSDAPVVLLRRDNDRALSEFDVTPNRPMNSILPLSVPGLDRSRLPTFLYLWQPEPRIVTASGG